MSKIGFSEIEIENYSAFSGAKKKYRVLFKIIKLSMIFNEYRKLLSQKL